MKPVRRGIKVRVAVCHRVMYTVSHNKHQKTLNSCERTVVGVILSENCTRTSLSKQHIISQLVSQLANQDISIVPYVTNESEFASDLEVALLL